MKKYIETLAILMALFCACSCNKESAEPTDKGSEKQPEAIGKIPLTFSVGTSKTVLNPSSGAINFNEADKISIFDGDAKNNEFTNTTPGNNQPSVNFRGEVTKEAVTYYALYPYQENAGFSEGTITNVSLPASQNATMNSFDPKANISVGATSSSKLELMNVCSLLKIVVNAGEHYGKAVICSNDGSTLCGTINVSFGNDGKPVATVTAASSSVTLTGTIGDKKNTDQTIYYIPVLPGTHAKGFYVKLYPTAESTFATATKYVGSPVTLERQNVANFGHIKPDVLPGEFTINSNGDKVRFSKGNLFVNETATPKVYGFENGQENDAYGTSTAHRTHFFAKNDYRIQVGTSYTSIFAKSDSDDNPCKGWRTLTVAEWNYMLGLSTAKRTCTNKYAKVVVNNLGGLLLFPDKYTLPEGINLPTSKEINNTGGSTWDKRTNYTLEQFQALETAGFVFLPLNGQMTTNFGSGIIAGYSDPFNRTNLAANNLIAGHYITSDISTQSQRIAENLHFTYTKLEISDSNSNYGYCVRLVYPVPTTTE